MDRLNPTTDPAVEAVQRAEQCVGVADMLPEDFALQSAREALAQIRDLYEKWSPWLDSPSADHQFSNGMRLILDELAPLIYPEDEL